MNNFSQPLLSFKVLDKNTYFFKFIIILHEDGSKQLELGFHTMILDAVYFFKFIIILHEDGKQLQLGFHTMILDAVIAMNYVHIR